MACSEKATVNAKLADEHRTKTLMRLTGDGQSSLSETSLNNGDDLLLCTDLAKIPARLAEAALHLLVGGVIVGAPPRRGSLELEMGVVLPE